MAEGWLGESRLVSGRRRKEASMQNWGLAVRRRPDHAPPPAGSPNRNRPRRRHIGTSQEPPRAEQSGDGGALRNQRHGDAG